jgi:hypothetical protein
MSHGIRGFVARPEMVQVLCARFSVATVAPLDAGVAFVSATSALIGAIDVADPAGDRDRERDRNRMAGTIDFLFDHPVMLRVLADLSHSGPVAFGVVRHSDEDEFDTVCLGKYRRMDRFA